MGCRPDRRGMTLVEMMISLTLFAVIMGVVFTFLNNSRQTYIRTSERVDHQQSIRAVITLLTREIRSTGCDPSTNGFDPFALADDTSLQCRADLDGNGDILGNNPDEDVTYSYNALTDELSRDGGAGAVVILRDITGLFANARINVLSINTQTNKKSNTATMYLRVEIPDLASLSKLLERIDRLKNVVSAQRSSE